MKEPSNRKIVQPNHRLSSEQLIIRKSMTTTKAFQEFVLVPLCLILLYSGMNAPCAGETQEMVRYTNIVIPLGGKNLVPNGSFEAGCAGWSSLGLGAGYQNAWAPLIDNWGNLAALHGTVEKSQGSHGQSFLRIRLGGEDTPVFNFDYFYPVNRRELRPLAANLGWIEVNPGQSYTLSLDMRASREGVPAAFGVQNENAGKSTMGEQEEILENVTLTTQWKRYSRTFTPKYHSLFVIAGPNLTKEEHVTVDLDAVQLEEGSKAVAFEPRSDLEIGIVPSAPAGVFTTDEPAALKITIFNNTKTPAHSEIKFSVTDFADKPVEFPVVDVEVPAQAAIDKLVALPPSWKGFYRILANYKIGKTEETRLLRVAIVPPRTTRETVVGVNHAYPTKFLVNLAKKAGVSWYRDWSLKWQHIEPEQGKLLWEISDPQMKRVGEQGANLMAMIPFPSADWNSTAPDIETIKTESPRYRAGGKGDDQELIPRARWAWMPKEVSELTGFIKTAVGRYKDEVQVWEFLNEPLFTSYSLPDSNVLRTAALKCYTMDDYLKLLKEAAPAIRTANPAARIMGGPGMVSSGRYTVPMVEAGILDSIDIFGTHDYPGLAKPETRIQSNDKLLTAMKEHGGVKPIWMTEFSYFGTDDLPRKPFKPIPGLWSETRFLSEKNVAEYIVRYITIFLGRGGEKIFLHSGCTGSVNKPGTESCMFADGAVRKVFPAVAVFTELMGPSPKFIADKTEGGGFIFAFETGKHALLVLWDPDEKTTAAIPAGVICKDIMGRVVTGSTVSLTGSPVYLIGPSDQAKNFFEEIQTTVNTNKSTSQVSLRAIPDWRRPIRIPEEIPLSHAEPSVAIASELSTWRIPFQLSKDVLPGSVLKLQLWGGRNNKGHFPGAQSKNPGADGYITATTDDGTSLSLQPDKQAGTFVLSLPKDGFKKGRKINVILGDCTGGGKGIRVCPDHVFNKFFVLYSVTTDGTESKFPQWAGGDVWAKGTDHRIVAACTMHILGGAMDHLRAYVPAVTKPGRVFAVLVRPEDKFGNLSHRELGAITISLDGKPLLSQVERVPDSTCLQATVSLPAAGIHRLTVRDVDSGLQAVSNPTHCSESNNLVCWGMIHGHTELSDGTGCIDDYFRQLKNEVLLDFTASSDHDHLFETSDEFWAVTRQAVKRWNKPPEFVAFLGYEWAKWRKNGDGDRNVYYLEDDRPMYRSDDGKYPSPPKLFEALGKTKEKALVIVHHPAHGGNFCDWKDHSPEHERLVEIFQTRGSYECSPEDGNTVPERTGKVPSFAKGYVRDALALGWRVGFSAGGDDHSGHWGTEFRFGPYEQGLMSIEVAERTRPAIFEAMHNRRTVATTGSRMLLTYHLNGSPLGSELNLKDSPELSSARKLTVEFHGMAPIAQIDIIRNNKIVYSERGNGGMDINLTWQDTEPIDKTWMPAAKYCNHPFTFYYVRVIQTDGEIAWASPVWIDP